MVIRDNSGKSVRTASVADYVFEQALSRIQSGEWPVGYMIPSERTLVEELGVSRIALRDAMLRLRTLGLLDVSQGKRATVARMDSSILSRLFPLMLSLEGEKTFQDIFQFRLSVESDTTYLAAEHRTDEDLAKMDEIIELMCKMPAEGDDVESWTQKDLALHRHIALATGNPIYVLFLDAVAGFMTYFQTVVDSSADPKREKEMFFHEAIVEAIRSQDRDRARALMVSHLRSSAEAILNNDMLNSDEPMVAHQNM